MNFIVNFDSYKFDTSPKLNLFIKNYNKIISNNSLPKNTNNSKILTIIACHSNTIIKYKAIINNIPYLLFPNNDIIIINSSNEQYSDKLKNFISDENYPHKNSIKKYIEIPNDKYVDFGKYIYGLNTIVSENNDRYDYVVFTNDSIIIQNPITHFYNMVIKMDYELYAYNDSSEIKYHFQSYLYAIKYNAIYKLINYFENCKSHIKSYKDVIRILELNLTHIYPNNYDCFLKIANIPSNLGKNIYFHNNILYKLLLENNILPFLKIRALLNKK